MATPDDLWAAFSLSLAAHDWEASAPTTEEALAAAVELVLAPLRERAPERPTNPALLREELVAACRGGDLVALIRREGAPLALSWAMPREVAGRRELHLNELAVASAERGRGVGARLLSALESAARREGIEAITLDFMSDNLRVEPLYRRAGYVQVGVDLIGPLPRATMPESVRPFLDDTDSGAARALAERHRGWCESQGLYAGPDALSSELAADEHALVLERDGRLAGVVRYRLERSRARGDLIALVLALHLEPALDADASSLLLSAVAADAAQRGAARISMTLWSPTRELLGSLESSGVQIGRYKLRRALD